MMRKNIFWLAIGIALMLIVTLGAPAIAGDGRNGKETTPENIQKTTTIGQQGGGSEKTNIPPQLGWVKYGPIYYANTYYYVDFGTPCLGGNPVVVAGLAIPYTSPYYANQQTSINTESNWGGGCGQYVHVISHDGKSLSGSYINLIGIY